MRILNVCSDYNNDISIAFSACWRYGANFTWTYPSSYSGSTGGNGDNTLLITIPAQDYGSIDVTATGVLNGVSQSQNVTVWIYNCGNQYSVKSNSSLTNVSQFTLSPNPTSDFVTIVLPRELDNVSFDAELHNSLGQLIYKKKVTQSERQLDIAHLPKGFYNVILRNPSDKKVVFTNKLTKI